MNKNNTVQGIADVYDSSTISDFKNAHSYPIGLEMVFINDDTGKDFFVKVLKAFNELPKEKAYIVDFEANETNVTRSIDCVFRDKDTFRQVVNKTLDEFRFYDEREKRITPRNQMIDEAGEIASRQLVRAI